MRLADGDVTAIEMRMPMHMDDGTGESDEPVDCTQSMVGLVGVVVNA